MWTATFVDLIVMLLWPVVLTAAAWVIAIKALAERDEISDVVGTLTRQSSVARQSSLTRHSSVESNARRADVSPRRGNLSAIASGDDRRTSERRAPLKSTAPMMAQASLRTALSVLLATVLIAAAALPAHAGRFEFDPRRTEVRFVYKMAYTTQRGRFTKVSGTLDYDEAAPEKTKVSASITAASLTTGEALVDDELKGAAFFNVKASPVIAFKSLTVKSRSATVADVSGEITVNGITKPVTLKVSLKPHDDPALKHDAGARQFIATTRIQRSAFNMTDYQSMVDDDIDIEIAAIVRPR